MNDEINITMGEEDWQEIIVDKKLHIHISKTHTGIAIDLYRYNPDNPTEDDLLGSLWYTPDDLEIEE